MLKNANKLLWVAESDDDGALAANLAEAANEVCQHAASLVEASPTLRLDQASADKVGSLMDRLKAAINNADELNKEAVLLSIVSSEKKAEVVFGRFGRSGRWRRKPASSPTTSSRAAWSGISTACSCWTSRRRLVTEPASRWRADGPCQRGNPSTVEAPAPPCRPATRGTQEGQGRWQPADLVTNARQRGRGEAADRG